MKHAFTREQSNILLLADDLQYDNDKEQQEILSYFRKDTQLTDKTDDELVAIAEKLWQILENNNQPFYEDDGVKCDDKTLSQLREVVATF